MLKAENGAEMDKKRHEPGMYLKSESWPTIWTPHLAKKVDIYLFSRYPSFRVRVQYRNLM